MENQTPEPVTEPSEIPVEAPAAETDPLMLLAQAAKIARLAPADEERAVTLLKERLTGGRAGINTAIPPMIEGLPWIICVSAVVEVWEKLSVPMRRTLLSGIGKNATDPARRLRLSLARAIFKMEPAAGLKLAAVASADLKQPETGALSAKHRQFFFNVFIGKGKPWLLQLPLGDLKGPDAEALVHSAIECLQICPPFSQLSILRWASEAGRLKKATAADIEIAAKAVARWNAKFQRQLKAEIADLPPALEAVLKPEALNPAPVAQSEAQPEPKRKEPPAKKPGKKGAPQAPAPEVSAESPATVEPASVEAAAPAAPLEELFIPGRAERLAKKEEEKLAKKEAAPERPKPEPREPEEHRPERREERPVRLERAEKAARPFDLKEALRGVENYVAKLRTELEQTTAQLRRQEQEGKRSVRIPRSVEETSPAEVEALTRHNIRLEATVTELRQQLEDLASHHESVAESRLLHTEEPLAEGSPEQLKALLAIKLAESYETYEAMRMEPLDKVFRLDYRDLLGSVFEVLREAGVSLKNG